MTAAALFLRRTAAAACLSGAAVAQAACTAPVDVRDASSSTIKAYVQSQRLKVLTFAGYSGAGYEDPAAMLEHASRVLARRSPARTLVNIGATAEGIGSVYELAKSRGFKTIGIVSTLARDNNVALSPCVDVVFFIEDETWGGRLPDSTRLSPTSAAIVANSTSFVAIGGGDIARDEMLAARKAGKPVRFIPADMNHAAAIEKARKKGQPEPTDFRGAAHPALAGGR